MKVRLRTLVWLGGLAGIVAFLLLDRPESSSRPAAEAASPDRSSADSLKLPERGGLARARGELFGAPPAPKPAASRVVVAPAPVAPPLPYRFAGKVRSGAEEEVLITRGELVFAIKVGDTLDGMYRVESIGADSIVFLYLPLGTRDRIPVSSVLDPAAAPAAPPLASSIMPVEGKSAAPAQLRWEGPDKVVAGAAFDVALRVSTREALRAAPMQLRFEPGVLEPLRVRPGKFFGQGSFTYRVNPDGQIFVGASSATATPAAPPGADAELLVVTFKPLKRGATAELRMGALSLQGASGRAIAHEQVGAFRTAIQ